MKLSKTQAEVIGKMQEGWTLYLGLPIGPWLEKVEKGKKFRNVYKVDVNQKTADALQKKGLTALKHKIGFTYTYTLTDKAREMFND